MRITVHNPTENGLLLCGIPFAMGEVESGGGFMLMDQRGKPLPLWWEERARWPDGSVKWIFIHARLDGESSELKLIPDKIRSDSIELKDDSSIELGNARLICSDALWTFEVGDERVEIHPGLVRTDPELECHGEYDLELVESSPIAPLLRLRQRRREGLRFDHLLRVDPVNALLHWQQRISFLTEGRCRLRELGATLRFSTGGWAWPGLDGVHGKLTVLRPGFYILDDAPEVAGHPRAALRGQNAFVILEKGWQRAPFSISVEGEKVHLSFFPAEAEPLAVQGGTSFRHSVRIALRSQDVRPISWSLDPERACATQVFGPLMASSERTRKLFPGYERAITACLEGGRLSSLEREKGGERGAPVALDDEEHQDADYFGLQHYGDWPMALGAYGSKYRMYADNEYDTPYAYFLQFIRTGNPLYGEVGYHSAVHMADVDCKATNGDMRFHGYYDQAEDHAGHRPSGGELGHYWTDGLLLNYLLYGDVWSWEAARSLADFLVGIFAGEGDDAVRRHFLGCERAVGWPLVALAGVAEVTGDPKLLDKMRQMVAFLARFTSDPDRELEEISHIGGNPIRWWRICQEDGSKPFMLGVVLEGLERYHRLTGDPAAEEAIVNISRFLVEVMWVKNIEAFIYEWNAFNRKHREDVYPHYINMMVAPGLAYAYELTGEKVFKEVATRAFHAALWTLFEPGGGKEIGMIGRTSSLMVGRLYTWREREEADRAARMRPSNGVPFLFEGSPEEMADRAELIHREGTPRYKDGALLSAEDRVGARRDVAGVR
ncbi:hypothetical protein J7M22_14440 [Candidatus Poribacteria bacterium]|nr:hypothetical protein [Candidatus Poribacteria bacterium]